jgi:hypothetical protein
VAKKRLESGGGFREVSSPANDDHLMLNNKITMTWQSLKRLSPLK